MSVSSNCTTKIIVNELIKICKLWKHCRNGLAQRDHVSKPVLLIYAYKFEKINIVKDTKYIFFIYLLYTSLHFLELYEFYCSLITIDKVYLLYISLSIVIKEQ